jgi:hypothetical protein
VSLQEAFDCAFERQNGVMRISTMPISSSFNILLVEDENDIAVCVVKLWWQPRRLAHDSVSGPGAVDWRFPIMASDRR